MLLDRVPAVQQEVRYIPSPSKTVTAENTSSETADIIPVAEDVGTSAKDSIIHVIMLCMIQIHISEFL